MTQRPDAYTHPLREYRALTTRVALIDLPAWSALRLTGSDRVRFLNSMITNDVAALANGESCHAAITTVKGKIVAELFVLARDRELFVLVSQGDHAGAIASIDKHIIADDVVLENVSGRYSVLSVEGPRCRDLVWRIFPDAPLPLEALRFIDVDYQGIPITVLRNNVSGDRGFQLIVPAEHVEQIRQYIVQAGLGMDLETCGRAAWNIRRVENGLPWFGVDFNGDNFPKECRLDAVVSYDKGCFLGQETLARMHHRGHPNWLLVGMAPVEPASDVPAFLDIDENELPTMTTDADAVKTHTDVLLQTHIAHDTPLQSDDGAVIGRVTSPVFSPALGAPLCLAYSRQKLATDDARFVLDTGTHKATLKIVSLPIPGEVKHAK